MNPGILQALYILSAAGFILALKWMSAPATARRGVIAGEAGMLIAVIATLLRQEVVNYEWIMIALFLGSAIGIPLAYLMPMTAIPQRTALSHARRLHADGNTVIIVTEDDSQDGPDHVDSHRSTTYVVGAYVPSNFSTIGLPTCVSAEQTGCILAWNTSQEGRSGARMLIDNATYWWQGAERNHDQPPAICINPLNWRPEGFVPASRNTGSLPFPRPPFAPGATVLPALVQHLTGAGCRQGLLAVNIPYTEPFHDMVSLFTGSYHANDYGIFYDAIRANATLRVKAWLGTPK